MQTEDLFWSPPFGQRNLETAGSLDSRRNSLRLQRVLWGTLLAEGTFGTRFIVTLVQLTKRIYPFWKQHLTDICDFLAFPACMGKATRFQISELLQINSHFLLA